MDINSESIFGERLKKVLRDRNIRQNRLAKDVGITVQMISKIISGKQGVSLEKLVKISEVLNVSSDYLLGLSDVPSTKESIKAAAITTGLSEQSIKNLNVLKRSEKYSLANLDKILETLDSLISDKNAIGALAAIGVYLYSDFSSIIRHPMCADIEEAKSTERIPAGEFCIPIYENEWSENYMVSCRLSPELLERAVLSFITAKLTKAKASLKEEAEK